MRKLGWIAVAMAWACSASVIHAAEDERTYEGCWSRQYSAVHRAERHGQEIRAISVLFDTKGSANVTIQFTRVHGPGRWASYGPCDQTGSGFTCPLDGDAGTVRLRVQGEALLLETGPFVSMERELEDGGIEFFRLRGSENRRFVLYRDRSRRACPER